MENSIAVTGHRPDKLGGYDWITFGKLVAVAKYCLMHYKPSVVYTGMALGWDMAIAQACLELNIPYIACVPFKDQERKWSHEQQQLYKFLLQTAQSIVWCSEPGYAAWKMEVRNRYMVDHGDRVLALWNGDESGGTFNAVRYSRSKGKPLLQAWNVWCGFRNGKWDITPYVSDEYPVR